MNVWTLPPAPPGINGVKHVIDAGPTLSGLLDVNQLSYSGEVHLAAHIGYIESDGYYSPGDSRWRNNYCAHEGEYLLVQFDTGTWAVTSPQGLNARCRDTGQPVPIEIGG